MYRQLFCAALAVGVLSLAAAGTARGQDAELQREINQAIDRGVAHLRNVQDKDGHWSYGAYTTGSTALAAWTLLECGVPADDAQIQKAAWLLRKDCLPLTHNYSACLALMFFDRLGDPLDEPLIESLALRIMASQGKTTGGWYYDVVPTPASEIARLKQYYERAQANKEERPKVVRQPRDLGQVAPEIRQQLAALVLTYDACDNSNTQFALLALWVARRHGMPVGRALATVERYFRLTQSPTGCWKYPGGPEGVEEELKWRIGSVTAMTAAGLLGLAVGHEAAGELNPRKKPRPELTRDPQVKLGLAAMAALIGTVQKDRSKVPIIPAGDERAPGKHQGYYTLWSLERMAMAYGLKTIGGKDWYSWGAQILVVNQQANGSWHGDFPTGGCDTCFALLFLKRANVAPDLTASLKNRVTDPGKTSPRMKTIIDKQEGGAPGRPVPRKEEPPRANETPRPAEGVPAEAARLSKELVDADAAQQTALLEKLRDTPGPTYTQALANAIPKLRGTAKTRARLALAQRLEKLDAEVLRLHLKAVEAEMRRASATAAGARKLRELTPDLINLLDDGEATVLQAAHAALRQITEQDFGPELDATPAERAAAVEAWRKWWKQQS